MENIFYSPIVLTVTVIAVIIAALSKYITYRKHKFWSNTNVKLANPRGFFVVLWKKIPIGEYQQQVLQSHGKVFGIGTSTLICAEPDMISAVLSKEFTSFINRREIKLGENNILTNFLSTAADDNWKRIRAIVSPTFSSGKLRKMRPMIDDCLQMLVSDLNRLITANDGEIDMKIPFGAFTMNVICQVAFGTKVDALDDHNNPIIVNARKFFNRDMSVTDIPKLILLIAFPKIAKLLRLNFFPVNAVDFFDELTKKIIKERQNKNSTIKRYDFLQLLLDAIENGGEIEKSVDKESDGKNAFGVNDNFDEEYKFVTHNKTMSESEMISQCVLFFIAGYDTTATTLSYATYLLACNPDVQQTVYEEAKYAFQSNSEIDIERLSSFKHIDAVISETLRLYPPAVVLERTATKDCTINLSGNKIRVKKGVVVHIPVYAIHRHSENFPEPDAFRPERFYPENRAHHPYAYLPFGAGPRNCVARRLALMEAKLALLYAVYNFRFSTTDKTKHPPDCYSNVGFIAPKEIILKVEKR